MNESNNSNNKIYNQKKPKKKMNPVLKFVLIVSAIVLSFVFVAGAGVVAFLSNKVVKQVREPQVYEDGTVAPQKKDSMATTIRKVFAKVPERTNFLIMGLDEDKTRTDVMIIGSFNSITKKISMVSIPRDIMVSVPKEEEKLLNAHKIYPPDYLKLNEVHAYGGKEFGVDAIMKQIEHDFGIELDYYAKMDPSGFRKIIDAVDGVDYTLTRDYNYYDPDQNFRINLKAGKQHLNGSQAEQLVRYRHDYAGGDLQRIGVQQEFMGELFRQVLSKEKLMSNAPELLVTLLDCVTTNLTIPEASKYLSFLPSLSADNVDMYSMTGDSYQGPDGRSYLRLDSKNAREIIDEAFFGLGDTPPKDSKELRLVVLNGSGKSGLAKSNAENLTEKGYNVVKIGDFAGERTDKDRIFVKKSGYGQDLKSIYKDAELIVNKGMVTEGADITLVIGISSGENINEDN